ncbi:MAG: potassium channel protein [Candidatus Brockarchaeota archaeon]|nr:potassium channel protein [Candidatus Brockarchaeota archaeon]
MDIERLAAMLAQLKEISEMMVDLAYSAFLFGSKEIADHVLAMEKTVDKLHTEFELAVLKSRESLPAQGLLGLIRLALAAEELADASKIMAEVVKRGVRAHPVVQMAIEKAEETIVMAKISHASELCHKGLGEIGLEDDIGMRVIAVKRGKSWTYNPQDDFVLNPGDLIIAMGYAEGKEKLLSLANPQPKQ